MSHARPRRVVPILAARGEAKPATVSLNQSEQKI
jgi:hypothetical protein